MTFTLIHLGADAALRTVLEETAHSTKRFTLTEKAALAQGAVLSAGVQDKETWQEKMASARAQNPALRAALILDKNKAEPEEEEREALGLCAVFTRPLRVAHLLDALATEIRLAARKSPRALAKDFVLHPQTFTITDTKKTCTLSAREAGFLLAVLDAGREGLSRMRAMTDVWGFHREAESHAVETAAYRLRQKLQEIGLENALVTENGAYYWRI